MLAKNMARTVYKSAIELVHNITRNTPGEWLGMVLNCSSCQVLHCVDVAYWEESSGFNIFFLRKCLGAF